MVKLVGLGYLKPKWANEMYFKSLCIRAVFLCAVCFNLSMWSMLSLCDSKTIITISFGLNIFAIITFNNCRLPSSDIVAMCTINKTCAELDYYTMVPLGVAKLQNNGSIIFAHKQKCTFHNFCTQFLNVLYSIAYFPYFASISYVNRVYCE